jgi:hypothetical protein
MTRIPARPVCLLLALASCAIAQQVGNAQRNYTLNGLGSNAPSFVQQPVGAPSQAMSHVYNTSTPAAPLVWAYSSAGQIGALVTASNSIDLNLGGVVFLLDFLNPTTPLSLIAMTGSTGSFSLTHPTSAALTGATWYLAFAHAAATSPDGYFVSQVQAPTFLPDPSLLPSSGACSAIQVVPLTDDSFSMVSLGFPFVYYGTTYTTMFIGSNGYITFNTGDVTLGENVAGFLANQPRISMCWDDLNPAVGGNYTFFTDGVGNFEVCINSVPEFSIGGSNTMRVNASNGTLISFNYFAMSLLDCLVGLSPGGNQATGMPVNLSLGVPSIPANQAAYQHFVPPATPFDLAGLQITWILSPTGVPIAAL